MIQAIAPVATLLLGIAILLTGQGLQGVLVPVRATLEAFSTLGVGYIGAFYFLGFTFGCWRGADLIRRAGHVRVFAAMTAVASAAPLLQGLWVNLWTWGLMRFATGFCLAVLYVVIESWLNERATNENRGTVFSAYIIINMTMLAVGQQMLLLGDPGGLGLFAVTSILISLAAVPVLILPSEQPEEVEKSRFDLALLYRNSPSGMLGSLTSGLVNGAFWSLAPVFTAAMTQNVSMAAWFMTAGVLGGPVGQWPLGWWSDRVDRRYVMVAACLGGLVVGLLLWQMSQRLSPWGILALGFAWGAFAFPLYSVSVAQANDRAEPGTFVSISSGLLLMYGIGAVVGPFLASGVMTFLGAGSLFGFAAAGHALLTLYVIARTRREREVPEENHTPFNDALTSAMTASQVYEDEIELHDGH
ncbi:MAG: MFS transporter [Xanthomonadales bacterium]|nr:MFS transporter [Xanthomonadales bacterium]